MNTQTMNEKVKPKKRRIQERAEITRDNLLNAALALFSERGFDGVTIRDIEIAAEVQRGLLSYHYDDKNSLWKRVIDRLFGLLDTHMGQRMEFLGELPPRERVAFIIRTYVRFAANHPELNRLMIQEGKKDDWRLRYIVDTHIQPIISGLQELVEDGVGITHERFVHWYYVFVGGAALFFSVGPEARALFEVDAQDPQFVEEHAQFLIDCLLGQDPPR